MSELISLGISHKTAPVEVRERLALGEREAERLLRDLAAHDEVHEAVAISTCNRTEIYLVSNDPVQAEADVLGRLARAPGSDRPSSPTSSTPRATATPPASSTASRPASSR
jgi:glutamyl-tRNA reductase